MKLQQPRNYDFRVPQFDPPRSQSGNDCGTTTSPLGHHREANVALTTTAKLQQLRVNSREMTTFAESCNNPEMQRPWNDKLEIAPLRQNLRRILRRFVAVVVSSAFWKSLIRGPKTHQNPEIPKKRRVYTNFFEKFAWTFVFFLVTRVRKPTEFVQKNLFRWTFLFWVDFFGWIFLPWLISPPKNYEQTGDNKLPASNFCESDSTVKIRHWPPDARTLEAAKRTP